MQQVRIQKQKAARAYQYDALPLDPRDPGVLRAKTLMRQREARATERGR